jgi:hypothetical protein
VNLRFLLTQLSFLQHQLVSFAIFAILRPLLLLWRNTQLFTKRKLAVILLFKNQQIKLPLTIPRRYTTFFIIESQSLLFFFMAHFSLLLCKLILCILCLMLDKVDRGNSKAIFINSTSKLLFVATLIKIQVHY